MKLKLSAIWRIAIALVLVLGASLVTATPVAAAVTAVDIAWPTGTSTAQKAFANASGTLRNSSGAATKVSYTVTSDDAGAGTTKFYLGLTLVDTRAETFASGVNNLEYTLNVGALAAGAYDFWIETQRNTSATWMASPIYTAAVVVGTDVSTVTITSPLTASPVYVKQGNTVDVTYSADGVGAGQVQIEVGGVILDTSAETLPVAKTKTVTIPDPTTEGAKNLIVRARWTGVAGATAQASYITSSAQGNAAVVVDNTAPVLTGGPPVITSPTATSAWIINTSHDITWNTGVTETNPLTTPITLYYSLDGTTWAQIGSAMANTSPYTWTVANAAGTTARIKLVFTDKAGNTNTPDQISPLFTIYQVDTSLPTVDVTVPANNAKITGAAATVTATATDTQSVVVQVVFAYSADGGAWTNFATDTTDPYTQTLNTVAFPDGTVLRIKATATNGIGAYASDINTGITVDNSAPTGVAVTAPTAGYVKGTIAVTGTATDTHSGVASVLFRRSPDGTAWTDVAAADTSFPYSVNWNTAGVADGTYRVKAIATNGVGLTTESTVITGIIVDNTSPAVLAVTSPNGAEVWQTGSVHSITWTPGTDANPGTNQITIDLRKSNQPYMNIQNNVNNAAGTYSWTLGAITPDTHYRIRLTFTDLAGNTFTDDSLADFVIWALDSTAPSVNLTAPATSAILTGTVSVTATASDAESGIKDVQFAYSLNSGGSWTNIGGADDTAPYSVNWNTNDIAGHSATGVMVRATATNGVGLQTISNIATDIIVDNTDPAVTLTAPIDNSFVKGTVAVTATATDAHSGVASVLFEYNDGSWHTIDTDTTAPYSVNWDTTALPDAQYKVQATATDMVGRTKIDHNDHINVDNTLPTITSSTLLSPNGGESWARGTTYNIVWVAGDITDANFAASPITLFYSTDNGTSWTQIDSVQANDGTYAWLVSAPASIDCLVKIVATDKALNTNYDVSDGVFRIYNVETTAPTVTVNAPNGGESYLSGSYQVITWTATDDSTPAVQLGINLYFSSDSGSTWGTMASDEANDGAFSWEVPSINSAQCLVKVEAVDAVGNVGTDFSDGVFSISELVAETTPPVVVVNTPNGGESFTGGTTQLIGWTATDNVTPAANITIALSYSTDAGSNWTTIPAGGANNGTYAWTLPAAVNSSLCLVKVVATDASLNAAFDISDNVFTIASPAATPVPVTTISLTTGWNLVSLPQIPTNSSILSVLGPVMPNVIGVYYWDAGNATPDWLSYVPGPTPDNLSEMNDGKAYWVHMNATVPLSVFGDDLPAPGIVPHSYNLVAGWNMLGFKSTTPRAVTGYLAAINGKYTRIYGFNEPSYSVVNPTGDLQPTCGYWIAMTEAGVVYP